MAGLSKEVKRFIIQQLATGDGYQTVADAVKELFDIKDVKITRQLIYSYDPTVEGRTSEKWKERRKLYDETREAFRAGIEAIPSTNKAVRIRRLERMAQRAEEMRNYQLSASIYEQIAKEMGDVYTNTRKLAHSGSVGIEALLADTDE